VLHRDKGKAQEQTKMPAASSAGIKEIYLIKGGHVISIVGKDEFNLRRTLQYDFKLNAIIT